MTRNVTHDSGMQRMLMMIHTFALKKKSFSFASQIAPAKRFDEQPPITRAIALISENLSSMKT